MNFVGGFGKVLVPRSESVVFVARSEVEIIFDFLVTISFINLLKAFGNGGESYGFSLHLDLL